MSRAKAESLGVKPLARIISYADAATAPIDFTIAPSMALPVALEKAGLKKEDISKFELNEAFSVVARVNEKVKTVNRMTLCDVTFFLSSWDLTAVK
ncbi:hypothetical protein G6F68_021474 [Rhizopus microsporus]|nr:hypothetical protein G6F68_021474 [Rhizopus microsporus]